MPNVAFDASSLVGALLREGSKPERALLRARVSATICLSDAAEAEIREVFARPKFARYLTPGRADSVLAMLTAGARRVTPHEIVTDCRDAKDNKYLELAAAAFATFLVASDDDLLTLHPWRGINIVTPAAFIRHFESAPTGAHRANTP